ncbi:hypothetical protein GARC_0882 [Paraglaciecola arctica BSs20135]|uniref:Uncharacterized protein n=1 Tax=Paraglaciecola arctica BSs20135 TaxID=493475 RepID=K6YML3_9ALTE|nr:hypothetical protein GARC_0882 [Paraglaciecola arctica BSs20135]
MWQLLALIFTFIGVLVIYLTNKNQGFIARSLSKKWRIASYCCWSFALVSWLQIHVFSAAFFIWLFILSTLLICIPLLSLRFKFDKRKRFCKGIVK